MGNDQFYLGCRNVSCIDATNPSALTVYFQHDLGRSFTILAKIFLDHHYDKLHRREVVVEQYHFVHRRRLKLLFLPLQHGTVLLVRENCHTPILNISREPAIPQKPHATSGL